MNFFEGLGYFHAVFYFVVGIGVVWKKVFTLFRQERFNLANEVKNA